LGQIIGEIMTKTEQLWLETQTWYLNLTNDMQNVVKATILFYAVSAIVFTMYVFGVRDVQIEDRPVGHTERIKHAEGVHNDAVRGTTIVTRTYHPPRENLGLIYLDGRPDCSPRPLVEFKQPLGEITILRSPEC